MEQEVLRAALRILASISTGRTAQASDIDLVRSSGIPEERDLDLDELDSRIAERSRCMGVA
jgi:hypothetical protein